MNRKAHTLIDTLNSISSTPQILIEVGCIRNSREIPSDGFSTYYLGQWAIQHSAFLYIIDRSSEALNIANTVLRTHLSPTYNWNTFFMLGEGEQWLKECPWVIDFLHLDGGIPSETKAQFLAALPKLSPGAKVCIDDCHSYNTWKYGKGNDILPELESHGWKYTLVDTEIGYKTAVCERV